jgi:hypothetical protein
MSNWISARIGRRVFGNMWASIGVGHSFRNRAAQPSTPKQRFPRWFWALEFIGLGAALIYLPELFVGVAVFSVTLLLGLLLVG